MALFIPLIILITTLLCSQVGFTKEELSIPKVSPPKVKEDMLPNGIKLFFLEDKSLPIVNLTTYIKVGSIYDNPKKRGVAFITGMNLISGGNESFDPEAISRELKNLGAEYQTSIGNEYGDASISILSKNAFVGLKIFFDALLNPRFDEKEFKLSKSLTIEQIKRDEELPKSIVSKNFIIETYGKDSPWANFPTVREIRKIKRKDVVAFHKNYIGPSNMIIAISGDIKRDEIIKLLNDYPKVELQSLPTIEKVKPEFQKRSKYIKKDVTNTFFQLGHLGVDRHNPDKYALEVLNYILGGGGFESRLLSDIRSERGLVYSVYSYFTYYKDLGYFSVVGETGKKNEEEVLTLVKKHLEDLIEGKISKDDVLRAKRALLFNQLYWVENSFSAVDLMARLDLLEFPKDYWKTYQKNVLSITLKDVKDVAKEYLRPDNLITVTAGPEK
ncbi:MAG: pitrilysin family protein [Pseudomonadota bacterium]